MGEIKKEDTVKKSFHWRSLTSFGVTLGFLMLAITGVALYLSPQGRVAHWTDWRLAGLDKEQWSAIHMVVGLLFIIAAGFHLYFNWGVFLRYIKTRAGFNLKREMAVAIGIVALLVTGTLLQWSPFSYVVKANERIKVYWDARNDPAPYPHAEASTLEDFARRTGVSLEDIQARLANLGMAAPDASVTIAEAAHRLGLAPNALFNKLGLPKLTKTPENPSARSGVGLGWGRQSLQEVCLLRGIDIQETITSLEAAGVRASGDESLKAIAEHAQRSPAEILAIIEVGNRVVPRHN